MPPSADSRTAPSTGSRPGAGFAKPVPGAWAKWQTNLMAPRRQAWDSARAHGAGKRPTAEQSMSVGHRGHLAAGLPQGRPANTVVRLRSGEVFEAPLLAAGVPTHATGAPVARSRPHIATPVVPSGNARTWEPGPGQHSAGYSRGRGWSSGLPPSGTSTGGRGAASAATAPSPHSAARADAAVPGAAAARRIIKGWDVGPGGATLSSSHHAGALGVGASPADSTTAPIISFRRSGRSGAESAGYARNPSVGDCPSLPTSQVSTVDRAPRGSRWSSTTASPKSQLPVSFKTAANPVHAGSVAGSGAGASAGGSVASLPSGSSAALGSSIAGLTAGSSTSSRSTRWGTAAVAADAATPAAATGSSFCSR